MGLSSAAMDCAARRAAYVFVLSPNQTPTRDSIILEKLLNLKPDEPYVVNQVRASVWFHTAGSFQAGGAPTTGGGGGQPPGGLWPCPFLWLRSMHAAGHNAMRLPGPLPCVHAQIFANIWNALGIYPGIMIALMIPAARSNKARPPWHP